MKPSELKEGEYNPYYRTYIDKLGDSDLLPTLEKQLKNFPNFMASIPEEKLTYAYAPGKWTVLEALQHIIDTERIFQYRALRFSRNDKTPLQGFEQDDFVPESNANNKSIEAMIEEYQAVRASTLSLFKSFDEVALKRIGTASNSAMSVGAIGCITCGHQRHHRDIIRERYL
ncbi:DinB family protein [Maribacter algarum]|uniref:DinB family protein n=1 Tax=Maribacter algarum (ex Zhang et al. 2020) TaxID=2578118 RepID=A0A5S3PRT4_9FLAO|nr:DinB family protein [Maribacter algarum]TMM57450.1 DinB family protein [Maribacter algarum]